MILHYQPYTKQTERDELQWNYPWFHKGENKTKQMNTSNAYNGGMNKRGNGEKEKADGKLPC